MKRFVKNLIPWKYNGTMKFICMLLLYTRAIRFAILLQKIATILVFSAKGYANAIDHEYMI